MRCGDCPLSYFVDLRLATCDLCAATQAQARRAGTMANALEVPTDEEAAQAELYIPGLTNLALFHALPAVRP